MDARLLLLLFVSVLSSVIGAPGARGEAGTHASEFIIARAGGLPLILTASHAGPPDRGCPAYLQGAGVQCPNTMIDGARARAI
ncbi:MAG: hypothetical protein BMS9Abin10_0192 [Gammaproteobacteria bacterium]|nr:MAG: hypothetical protein BMS9Abin10_0192 [Gammaproteobacteria bacterium]